MSDEPDPIITKSITIYELMDGDGDRWISVDTEGDPPPHDCMGLLVYALEWYKAEVAAMVAASFDE